MKHFAAHKHANAYVISVNMGYGHERAAYGLKDLAHGPIITANQYPGIPDRDKELWQKSRRLYELVSRCKSIPVVGDALFDFMDTFQRIPPFYPRRDLSASNLALKQDYYAIEHLGLLKHLIEKLSKKPLPLICTFFLPAFAAELLDYPGDIYVVICDADMHRVWVSRDPKKSRIKYFAPNGRVVERLKLYGVSPDNIFLTGFPLPKDLIGGPDGSIVKRDLITRLCLLDPQKIFIDKYRATLERELGPDIHTVRPRRPLTVTFSVGGAGAQRRLAFDILQSLKRPIAQKKLRLRLVAGTRRDVADDMTRQAEKLGLKRALRKYLCIDYFEDRRSYFMQYTKILRETDILWTKPSELSFYAGAGLPIIMAPSIGSQEDFNRRWLKSVGAGISQSDPRYTNEWLFDWIESGGLARAAWNGYIEAPTHGAYRIESIVTGEKIDLPKLPLII